MTQSSLNIPNLDRLISYLEALPPEEFNMAHYCGTACCITGHCMTRFHQSAGSFLSIGADNTYDQLIMPPGWVNDSRGNKQYPLPRALRMLRHLRAEFVRTGSVVVDWDAPEAVEAPRKPWAPPLVIGADKPLPSSLTSLLREADAVPATATEA